jgi:hypothetical protein
MRRSPMSIFFAKIVKGEVCGRTAQRAADLLRRIARPEVIAAIPALARVAFLRSYQDNVIHGLR